MKFDDITQDGRLWAVRITDDDENELFKTFEKWNSLDWLEEFFRANLNDLESYFNITSIDDAIFDTISDANELQSLILDISPDADLDKMFRHLENNRMAEMMLGAEKAKGKYNHGHHSWLRLYALKFEAGSYLITGGAIKLTYKMSDRKHTLDELIKMEKVREFLKSEGVCDLDGFKDFINENG